MEFKITVKLENIHTGEVYTKDWTTVIENAYKIIDRMERTIQKEKDETLLWGVEQGFLSDREYCEYDTEYALEMLSNRLNQFANEETREPTSEHI